MADDRDRWRGEQDRHRSWNERDRPSEGAYYRGEEARSGPYGRKFEESYGGGQSRRGNREGIERASEHGPHRDEDYGRQDYGKDDWRRPAERSGRGSAPMSGREDFGRFGNEGVRDYGRGDLHGRWRDQNDDYERNYGRREQGGSGDYGHGVLGRGERGRYGGERGWWDRAGDEVSSWFGDDDAARRRERDARQGDTGAQHHRGRGPRGYTRSDERIREDVSDRLTDNPVLDASDIEVTVSGGEVTLSGTVDSRYSKRLAEDVAEDVSGVTHVQNNLRVRQQGSTLSGTSAAGTTSGAVSGTGSTNQTGTTGVGSPLGTAGTSRQG